MQAVAFLQRGFVEPRYQRSWELDPIVAVSFTGAFTFFVKAFGIDWLYWWQAGRPKKWGNDVTKLCDRCLWFEEQVGSLRYLSDAYEVLEQYYFEQWRYTVEATIAEYCDRHGLKKPNRCTVLKPEGSLTLMTGVGACGWHPPKGTYYIRRMTFGAYDPIAMAAIDYGYTVVPSQSCKDETGKLLDDPFDPRSTEWLVEVPVKEPWADLDGAQGIDPSDFPIKAQWDFYMQCQKHYVRFNSSATLEIYEHEIESLGTLIYNAIQNDEGYISAAILGRSKGNFSFPRLPFEPVSKEKYEELMAGVLNRRKSDDFAALLAQYDTGEGLSPQDAACDSGVCEVKGNAPVKDPGKALSDLFGN